MKGSLVVVVVVVSSRAATGQRMSGQRMIVCQRIIGGQRIIGQHIVGGQRFRWTLQQQSMYDGQATPRNGKPHCCA